VLQLRLATERFDAIIKGPHYTRMLYAYDAFWWYGIGGCDGITWSSVDARHGGSALLLSQLSSTCRQYPVSRANDISTLLQCMQVQVV